MRWGELQWRSASGKDLHYERWVGAAFATGNNYWDQMWRGACINHDTYAVAMSDHQFGAIDERRCGGQPSSMPVANNVCRASMVLGPDDILTISGMAHVPSSWSSYRLVADGCRESNETAPSSYALDHARAGNPFFALSLKTSSKAALLLLGSRVTMPVPGAPGCTLYTSTLNGWVVVAAPSGGRAVVSTPLPSGLKFKAMTQWMTLDVKANSLGIVLSDARELVIQ